MKRFFGAFAASATAALCALLALFLAWHHPLAPVPVSLACVALAVGAFMAPLRWVWLVFALLPLAGWMSWTGWLAVEELDLLLLAVIAGGHARIAWGDPGARPMLRRLPASWLWVLLPATWAVLAAVQGVLDAGGDDFGWWQGTHEPANALRGVKPLLAALGLLSLMRSAWRTDQVAAGVQLERALVAMLAVTGALVLWERLAYTGLLDVSGRYQASALFWEAQTGSAALAAVLVVGMPFALSALARSARLRQAWLPLLALALGGYASVVSHSLLVYAVVPLVLLLWWVLPLRLGPEAPPQWEHSSWADPQTLRQAAATPGWLPLLVLLGFGTAAWVLFAGSGWRGQLLLLGTVLLMLPLQGLGAVLPRWQLLLALLAGLLPALALLALLRWQPWAAQAWLVLLWCLAATALLWGRLFGQPRAALPALAGCVGLLAGLPALAWVRSGLPGLPAAALVAEALLALLVWGALRRRALWPLWQLPPQRLGGWLLALLLASLLAGVLGGSDLQQRQWTQLPQEAQQRQQHWSRSLALLQDPASWLLGHGTGRYAARMAAAGADEGHGGDSTHPSIALRWQREPDDNGVAVLSFAGAGQARLAQRVEAPLAAADSTVAMLRIRLRSAQPLALIARLCEVNTLSTRDCASAYLDLPAKPEPRSLAGSPWRWLELPLRGPLPADGPWYAPRPLSLVIGFEAVGEGARPTVVLDDISLRDGAGRELLGNRGFERGLAYWYLGSEGQAQYQAWQAGNVVVHLLVEQGLLGLLAWAGVLLIALWRLVFGQAHQRSLAPPLAAALLGLCLLGLGDSLLDTPRVAFLATWLLTLALAMPGGRRLPAGSPEPPARGLEGRPLKYPVTP